MKKINSQFSEKINSAADSHVANLRLFVAALSLVRADATKLDATWMNYLNNPPAAATQAATTLGNRADAIVAALKKDHAMARRTSSLADIDAVISGGGNLDAYWFGARMVLSRLAATTNVTVHRRAGASAGGMLPFEIALKGEALTLEHHLAYGLLEQENPSSFNEITAGLRQDHHWRMMAPWMLNKWNSTLPSLDGKIFLALSCLDPVPKLVLVSEFTSESQVNICSTIVCK